MFFKVSFLVLDDYLFVGFGGNNLEGVIDFVWGLMLLFDYVMFNDIGVLLYLFCGYLIGLILLDKV